MANATLRPTYLQERNPVIIVLDAQWASGPKRLTSILSLTSALEEVGGQCHDPADLSTRKRPLTHCIGRSMGLCAEPVYPYSFFNFGNRIGGCSMPHPGRLTPRKGPVHIALDAKCVLVPKRFTTILSLSSALE